VRAVLDPNVLISALLSPIGAPAALIRAWVHGAFELILSPLLVQVVERALAYPKLRRRIPADQARLVLDWLKASAVMATDPAQAPPLRSRDPGDDYLLALAASQSAALVSGDQHLLELAGDLPIYSPPEFLRQIESNEKAGQPRVAR
jgi:putative PIN family toxin of toxin-antitoxin system